MMKKLLLCCMIIASAWAAHAQEKKVWTLQECIEHALKNNLTVKTNLLNAETSKVNLDQSKFQMLPTLNGGASYGFNWGRSIDPTSNLFVNQRNNSINFQANSSLLLFNGFRLFNNYKQSNVDNEAAAEDFIKAKNDVIINVVTLYTTVIFNKELLSNAQSQLETTTQQLERTRKLAEAGSVPRGNVLDLEAQQASNELNVITNDNGVNLSILRLKQALQIPASQQMDIEVPELDVADGTIDETAEQIYEKALSAMPEVRSAKLKLQSSLFALKSTRGSYFPRLSINGNLFTNSSSAVDKFTPGGYPANEQLNDNLAQSASLQLSIPIFNGYQTRANVKRSYFNTQQAEINLTSAENTLRQSVETAYNDALASSKTYQSALKLVNARNEAFRMAKQRFDNGAVNFVEYQTAENSLFQAKSDLVRAKYDFIFKKKVLDFYQGKSIEL
ncbi:MAG TPA: TolC family protein [Cyclobacteriaceae bacterium]|nr:TolC family protein [Cyclobacteriaceae bacterium]